MYCVYLCISCVFGMHSVYIIETGFCEMILVEIANLLGDT